MSTRTIHTDLDLEVLDCGECGVHFAMPQRLLQERKDRGGTFYCPNGHGVSYRETELDRVRKRSKALEAQVQHERDQAQAARADAASARRSTSAVKGQLTRERKRTAAGTCPCCKRTFQQLTRHMQGQHPEYVAEHRAKVAT